MMADETARVFELFYQAPQAMDRSLGGLGLGLPIVRSLIEMHGGTVTAASEGLGKGSCFTLRLPRAELPAGTVAHVGPTSNHSSRIRVLVVDDNHDAADT